MPRITNRNPIKSINQKIPPLNKIHAALRKLKFFPNKTQLYAEEAQARTITPTNKIKPNISSAHLFIVLLC